MAKNQQSIRYSGTLIEDIHGKVDELVEAVSILASDIIKAESNLAKIQKETALLKPMFEALNPIPSSLKVTKQN